MKFRNIAIASLLSLSNFLFSQGPRENLKFDFDWKFNLGDTYEARKPEFNDAEWRKLNLPHDWSIEQEFSSAYASCTAYLPGGIGWYRKSFEIPESYRGKVISIQFDGVYNNSEVWINGHFLGQRPNGYISFSYDLTPYLIYDSLNVISVRVDHSKYADTRWYSGSGIYRHVWLNVTSPVHVALWGTHVTTPVVSETHAEISIETKISNYKNDRGRIKLLSSVVNAEGIKLGEKVTTVVMAGAEVTERQSIDIQSPILWNIDNPYLYKINTVIYDGNTVIDNYETTFGIRTLRFDSQAGFFLNGKNIKLKGVCLHHDGGSVGAAVPEKIWAMRLAKLKEAGCNAIRTSHNPVAPEFLDLCDRMGFLVMDEAFDEWEYPKRKWINGWNNTVSGLDGYSLYFREWARKDLKDMIERDKNHPSIIMWSIGNEIDYANDPYADQRSTQNQPHDSYSLNRPDAARMVEIAQGLMDVVKEVDVSRPVTMALANIGNSRRIGLPDVLDIVGYNYTESRYLEDHEKYPEQFLFGSENPHNYDGWLSVKNNDYISAQFLWTGVDYLGEAGKFPLRSAFSGLLDLTGHEKTIYYWRKSMWNEDPMLYITARRKREDDKIDVDPMSKLSWFVSAIEDQQHWNYSKEDSILVMAYTNCSDAELTLNGVSYGRKPLDPANSSIWWVVPFSEGEVTVVATGDDKQKITSSLVTVSDPKDIMIESDSKTIKADGQDVAIIEITLKDKDGNTAFLAENRIDFEVTGEGILIGSDNGNASCIDNMKLPWRKAYQGRCIAIIQSNGNKGTIKITARAAGLNTRTFEILAE